MPCQSTGGVNRYTSHTPHVFINVQMRTVCPHITHDVTRSRVAQVQVVPSTIESFHLLRNVSRHARNTQHIFLIFFLCSRSTKLLTFRTPCADSLEHGGDGYTDPEPRTGYKPNRIVDNQIINEQEDITCTDDNQITEIEGLVKSLSCNQSLLPSTQDSTESIAMPQDLNDEQIRALLASPRYSPEREASAARSQVFPLPPNLEEKA